MLLFLGQTVFAATRDRYAIEIQAGGVAGLADSLVKDQGKTGRTAGAVVRFDRGKYWDTGFGYNIALSRKRANTLRDLFVNRYKIAKSRFTIFAHGS